MAKVQNTLIGHASGSIGGATFSSWKGINVLKSKAEKVANPKTDPQLAQRSAMSQLITIGREVLGALNESFREMAVRMSAYNAFVKANLPSSFTIAGATAVIQPALVVLAKGTLQGFDSLIWADVAPRDKKLTWTDNSGQSGANASDVAMLFAMNFTTGEYYSLPTTQNRASGTAVVTIPGTSPVVQFQMYAYFLNTGFRKCSNSVPE